MTEKKRSNNPKKPAADATSRKKGGILREPAQPNSSKERKQRRNREYDKTNQNDEDEEQQKPTPYPVAIPAPTSEDVAMEIDEASNTSEQSSTTPIADQPPRIPDTEIAPHPKIPTNDRIHRITVK